MSRATVLGDAVVTSLNGNSFSIEFTAVRRYWHTYRLKDLKTLTVTVVIPSITQTIASRRVNQDITIVDVLIQKQVDVSDNDAVDLLADLAEEIAEYFRGLDVGSHTWVGTTIETFYDMEDMAESRLFSSLVRVSYRCNWVQ